MFASDHKQPCSAASLWLAFIPFCPSVTGRTVEVAWDHAAQSSKAKVCWASKSQARQRAGRTGRTCSGTVYRLIPRSTWQGLAEFETPALILASLREETLRLCCSRSRLTSDPGRLMSACLDAPQPETITQALQALVQMRAIAPALGNTSKRGGGGGPLYVPTEYGRILASMPVGLAQSRLVVAAAAQGLLAEGALLAAVQAVLPCPIQRPFAQPELYAANLQRFCGGSADRACQVGPPLLSCLELACRPQPLRISILRAPGLLPKPFPPQAASNFIRCG